MRAAFDLFALSFAAGLVIFALASAPTKEQTSAQPHAGIAVRLSVFEARLQPQPQQPAPRPPVVVLELTQRCECQARTEFDPDEECDE